MTAAGVKNHVQRARLRATNDVERSRRVLRLLYANWLAQVDRPADERAPIAIQKPNVIFAADPSAPPAARAIAPEDLDAAIDQTLLADVLFSPSLCSTTSAQDAWSEWYWQPNGSARPRAQTARGADRQAGGRALPPRAREAPSERRCAARGLSQGIAGGHRPDEPIPDGID